MVTLVALAQTEAWKAEGHAPEPIFERIVADFGPWLLLAALAAALLHAALRNRRYRALGVLSENDQARVHEALRAAEKRTVGEVVPVVVERSDAHPSGEWVAALGFLLLGSALLAPHLYRLGPGLFLLAQLALGALGFALARALPGFKRLFVSERRATEAAEEQAFQEFHRLDLHRTEAETGMLLFVSLFERRVVVLGDRGIDAKVGKDAWLATSQAILDGIARGSLREGLIEGIRRSEDVLAQHFPWTEGDRNEVPDRLVVRRH